MPVPGVLPWPPLLQAGANTPLYGTNPHICGSTLGLRGGIALKISGVITLSGWYGNCGLVECPASPRALAIGHRLNAALAGLGVGMRERPP